MLSYKDDFRTAEWHQCASTIRVTSDPVKVKSVPVPASERDDIVAVEPRGEEDDTTASVLRDNREIHGPRNRCFVSLNFTVKNQGEVWEMMREVHNLRRFPRDKGCVFTAQRETHIVCEVDAVGVSLHNRYVVTHGPIVMF
ncbi:hypothetical protein J6590_025604 [Homalodisca vitripennis]|nr:hypothetical protein J6590_025604 [Homalodisca vitripennis]